MLLSVCSVGAIGGRLVTGWAADRRAGGHLLRVALLLLAGSLACAVLATAGIGWTFALAALLTSASAWASNSLLYFAVYKQQTHAPGRMAGIILSGSFLGSAIGPLAFGITIQYAGLQTAWLLVALGFASAAAVVLATRRSFLAASRPREG